MIISPDQLIEALHFRYATKAFDPSRKIPAAHWQAIESSLTLTPSSFGLQPWKFIIVDSPDVREKLKSASWGQSQLTDASHIIVLATRTDLDQKDIDAWITRLSEVRGIPGEDLAGLSAVISNFIQPMNAPEKQAWNTRQVYIALGQLMTASALMGIDSCPLEGMSPPDYDEILGLTGTGYATAVACALGYRHESDKYSTMPKARFPHQSVVTRI